MSKYQRGKIYKIIDNITGKVYFGSTIEPTIARRLATHISNFKTYKQGKSGICCSYELFENNDYTIILVELFPCDSKDELLMRERYWIDNNECVNKNRPILFVDEKQQYQQQYRQEHKEKATQYYQENKEEALQYRKQQYQEHKDEIKQHYQEHKDEILEKHLQKITCECGKVICKGALTRHKKTKKHNELMLTK